MEEEKRLKKERERERESLQSDRETERFYPVSNPSI